MVYKVHVVEDYEEALAPAGRRGLSLGGKWLAAVVVSLIAIAAWCLR